MKHGGSLLLALDIYSKFVIIRVHLAVALPHKSSIKNSCEVDTSIFYVLYVYKYMTKKAFQAVGEALFHTQGKQSETDKEVMGT